jgi:DNA-directed RNA polymerase beta' subunit
MSHPTGINVKSLGFGSRPKKVEEQGGGTKNPATNLIAKNLAEIALHDVEYHIGNLPHFNPTSMVTSLLGPDLTLHSVCDVVKPDIEGVGTVNDLKMGPDTQGKACETCSLTITGCPGHIGRIKLPEYFANPLFVDMIVNILISVCNDCSAMIVPQLDSSMLSVNGNARLMVIKKKSIGQHCPRLLGSTVIAGVSVTPAPCGRNPKYTKLHVGKFYTDNGFFQFNKIIDGVKTSGKRTLSDAFSIIDKITDEDAKKLGFDAHPRKMFFKDYPVMPHRVRPQIFREGQWCHNKITKFYQNLVSHSISLSLSISRVPGNKKVATETPDYYRRNIRKIIHDIILGNGLVDNAHAPQGISSILSGKEGYFRKHIICGRVNYSARTVLSPDSSLKFGEIGVPDMIARVLTRNIIVNKFNIEKLGKLLVDGKINYVNRKTSDGQNVKFNISEKVDLRQKIVLELKDRVFRHLENGDKVIFNRQPTLSKNSIMTYTAVIQEGSKTFKLHLSHTTAHNADFDGDEGSIHIVQTDKAHIEAEEIMHVKNCMMSSRGTPLTAAVYDTLTGVYLLTDPEVNFDFDRFLRYVSTVNFSGKGDKSMERPDVDLTDHYERCDKYKIPRYSGQSVFSLLLPRELTYHCSDVYIREGILIKGQIGKKQVGHSHNSIVQFLHNSYSPKVAQIFLNELYLLIKVYLEDRGFTVGVEDCFPLERTFETNVNEAYAKAKLELQNLRLSDKNITIRTQAEQKAVQILSKVGETSIDALKKFLDEDNSLSTMMKAGTKGKEFNLLQMVGLLGQVCVEGKRILPQDGETRSSPYFAEGDPDPAASGFVCNSFGRGLTPSQMFAHQSGSREGLIHTAVSTQETGTISRNMYKALEDISIGASGGVVGPKHIFEFIYGRDGLRGDRMTRVEVDGKSVQSFFDAKSLAREINSKYGYAPENGIKMSTNEELLHQTEMAKTPVPVPVIVREIPSPDFPYITTPSFGEMYNKLQTVCHNPPEAWLLPRQGERMLVERSFPNNYEEIDSLNDHFVEQKRILSREEGYDSPSEAWKKISSGNPVKEVSKRRQLVYSLSRGCDNFNPIFACMIYGQSKRILDISSGWGDRLIGAFASPSVELYRGWSGNPELTESYSQIGKACQSLTSKNLDWKIETSHFEDQVDHFGIGGDMVGYFDTVIASPTCNLTKYSEEENWYLKYYLPMLKLATNSLRIDGRLFLYIPTRTKMWERASNYLLKLRMVPDGSYGFTQTVEGKIEPTRKVYIWRKS